MTDFDTEFGDWLRRTRKARGLSQGDITRAMGRHQTQVSRIENGTQPVTLRDAYRYAALLRAPLPVIAVPETSLCSQCLGRPPKGFTCNTCSAAS